MPCLSTLPNELIIEIWRHLRDPEAIASFAVASKKINSVGSPYIEEHNRLRFEHSSFGSSDTDNCSGLAELLDTLLLNPRAALYVRDISIDGWREVWDIRDPFAYYDGSESRHIEYDDQTMELFIKAVKQSPYIRKDDVESWVEELQGGDEGGVLSLILMRLPNLKSLEISKMGASGFHLFTTILRIAESQDADTLSRLRYVQLRRIYFAVSGFIQAFSALPSVKAIRVSGPCDEDDWDVDDFLAEPQDPRITLPSKPSAVTDLSIAKCKITTERLCRILQRPQALENFCYLNAAESMEESESQKMVNALCTHAKYTLQTLYLTSLEEHMSGTVSLTEFEDLKEISIESDLLSSDTGRINFTTLLPPTVEELRLLRLRSIRWLEDDLSQMEIHKAERMPNLKWLTIKLFPCDNTVRPAVYEKMAIAKMVPKYEDIGIKMNVIIKVLIS